MSKVEIETDCAAFLKSIENWDGQDPPFRNVVASAIYQAFRCRKADEFRRRLVEALECGGWSPASWASGAAQPHRFVQESAVRQIAELIKELDEAFRQENARTIAFMRSIGHSYDGD